MKYVINLNQKALIKISPNIKLSEAVILDYLNYYCKSVNEKIEKERVDGFTWINYKNILEDLPLLEGRTPATIVPKIKRLEEFGYIKTKELTDRNGHLRKMIKLTEKIEHLFSYLNDPIKKTKCAHLDNLMYNNTIDYNTNNNKYTEKDKELTHLLYLKVKENYPFVVDKRCDKDGNFIEEKMVKDYEKMSQINRLDKRDYQIIEFIINWSQKDDFWKQNIRSVAKLRDKFETLMVRAQGEIKKRTIKNYDK